MRLLFGRLFSSVKSMGSDPFAHTLAVGGQVRQLSVAAPAFNEALGIEKEVSSWLDYLAACPFLEQFEVIICDDGSQDQTVPILTRLAHARPELKVVRHLQNQGAAAALATAIASTQYEWVLLNDCDGQFAIEDLAKLVAAIEGNRSRLLAAEVRAASGIRLQKSDQRFYRAGSWLSGAVCNFIFGVAYRDFNCAFKLIEGRLLRSLCLETRGMNYSTEVTAKLLERGVVQAEVVLTSRLMMTPVTSGPGRSPRPHLKRAWGRALFVFYLLVRRLLLKHEVIRPCGTGRALVEE